MSLPLFLGVFGCQHGGIRNDSSRVVSRDIKGDYAHVRGLESWEFLNSDAEESFLIGLGESSHGSGGFYEVKFEIIKYLVEKKGVRALLFEQPDAFTEPMKRFLSGESSDVIEPLKRFYKVWQAREIAKMFTWIRDFNQSHREDPILFYGYDTRQPAADGKILKKFALSNGLRWQQFVKHCLVIDATEEDASKTERRVFNHEKLINSQDFASCNLAIDHLKAKLDLKLNARGENRFQIQAAIDGYQAWLGQMYYRNSDQPRSNSARDLGMAKKIINFSLHFLKGKPAVIWAHNAHILFNSNQLEFVSKDYRGTRTMGTRLREFFGKKYHPIAISSYELGFRLSSLQPPIVKTAPASFLESYLFETFQDDVFLDKDHPLMTSLQTIWGDPSDDDPEMKAVLANHFSGFIFLRKVQPMELL
ncbi:erythromycin esterase family protein [bacterium]|jgi:erythromycin esterase|nr:erythromycin esterase family protein [bacterium]